MGSTENYDTVCDVINVLTLKYRLPLSRVIGLARKVVDSKLCSLQVLNKCIICDCQTVEFQLQQCASFADSYEL